VLLAGEVAVRHADPPGGAGRDPIVTSVDRDELDPRRLVDRNVVALNGAGLELPEPCAFDSEDFAEVICAPEQIGVRSGCGARLT